MREPTLVEEMTSFGEWAAAERNANEFVWLGTCEADPRTPGPPTLVWGRGRDDGLYVAVWPETGSLLLDWEKISDETWAERYPHAGTRPHLSDDYKRPS